MIRVVLFLPLLACDTGECKAPFVDQVADGTSRPYALALVPGTSEQWGHHKAPPKGVLLSDEFAQRLDRAHALWADDQVAYVLVSGGSVDAARPDYNEARSGREYLTRKGMPEAHVLIDPVAEHSTTNVRNADKLAVEMGLDRILIVTTTPQSATLTPADVTTQGYYFLYHRISTFDSRSVSAFGYKLGKFRRVLVGKDIVAIEHCEFDHTALAADTYGP